MKNIVTGGAGFIGSHLIDWLMKSGEEVICLDNLCTGDRKNIERWDDHPKFKFIKHDITNPIDIEVEKIWHLACPASSNNYKSDAIKTSLTNSIGTFNVLDLATKNKAKLLFTSTSEIYGNSPSNFLEESNFGYVNPNGLKSCYSEGKRLAESLCFDFFRSHNTQIRIARIFNVYGPRIKKNDGRVISNFIYQAIAQKALTINGSGKQKRCFCYVDDIIPGLIKLMDCNFCGPINLGNPKEEYNILSIANLIKRKIKVDLPFKKLPKLPDEIMKRKPSIKLAKEILNWEPKINIDLGLEKTISYIKLENL